MVGQGLYPNCLRMKLFIGLDFTKSHMITFPDH